MLGNRVKRTALAPTLLALILSAEPTVASGQTPGSSSPSAVDVEAGKVIAVSCASCHGPQGISNEPEVPHLAGQHGAYILRALRAYRDGRRTGETMEAMITVVAALSEADIVNVAVYFASLEPFTSAAAPIRKGGAETDATRRADRQDPFEAGRAATEVCAGCHGETGNSDRPRVPSLAGQPAEYLIAALNAYKGGSRADGGIHAFAQSIGDAETENIAAYYAALPPKRAEAPVAGDPDAGRVPAAACAVCHGKDGNSSDPGTPRLAGLDAEYLAAVIRAYQVGTRDHAVMQDLVPTLEQDEVVNLAAFYATKEPKSLPKPLTTKDWAQRCDRCHGPDGRSTDPRFPILAGQSEPYLVRALRLYHGGGRPSSTMYAMSFQMVEDDIKKLAAYYAGKTVK
jgi:cytochrome c553